MLVTANLGSDALMVLNQGIATFLNIELGYGVLINNLTFFILVIIVNRKSIGIATFAVALLLGPSVNLITWLNIFSISESVIMNYLLSIGGIIVSSIGIALYMYSNTGLGPFESLTTLIAKKTKIRFGLVKILFDIIAFGIGVLLGGTFGVCSIIAVIAIGPIIDFVLFLLKKTNLIKDIELESSSDINELPV